MKAVMYICISIGGLVGGYLPVLLWHAGSLSGWSLLGGAIGSLIGVFVAYKFNNYVNE